MIVVKILLSAIGLYVAFVIVETLVCFSLTLATRHRDVARIDRRPLRVGASAVAVLTEIANTIRLHLMMLRSLVFRRGPKSHVLFLDAAKTPILLIPGYGCVGSCWAKMHRLLRQRRAGPVFEMMPHAVFEPIEELAKRVGERIDTILNATGATQIDLVGHSMGGLVARYYLEQLGGAQKVRKCITIAAPHHGTLLAVLAPGQNGRELRPGSAFLTELNLLESTPHRSQVVSIWSPFDNMTIPPTSSILGGTARNVRIDYMPHYTMLFSPQIADIIVHELER